MQVHGATERTFWLLGSWVLTQFPLSLEWGIYSSWGFTSAQANFRNNWVFAQAKLWNFNEVRAWLFVLKLLIMVVGEPASGFCSVIVSVENLLVFMVLWHQKNHAIRRLSECDLTHASERKYLSTINKLPVTLSLLLLFCSESISPQSIKFVKQGCLPFFFALSYLIILMFATCIKAQILF